LKAFAVSNAEMTPSPASQSSIKFGYPGCVPTISASGASNGIVWVLDPGGALRAYDAANFANELYDSNQNQERDALGGSVKFSAPMVANGKVYAGTQDSIAVYGLLSTGTLAISNAASGNPNALAPGAIASIYGSGLATSTATANSFPLPASLGGALIAVNSLTAPIFYASPSQINSQIPFETAAGPASVTLTVNGAAAGTAVVPILIAAPGLFTEPGGAAAALNQDGSVNSPDRPAATGSEIAVFLTGLGPVEPVVGTRVAAPASSLSTTKSAVSATMGSAPAFVTFARLAPGFAGLYQVNLIVPQLPGGRYLLQISIGGISSNAAGIDVR